MSSRPASTKRSLVPYEFAPAIPQHPDPITQRQKGHPARRGRGRKPRQRAGENWLDETPAERHVAKTCTRRP